MAGGVGKPGGRLDRPPGAPSQGLADVDLLLVFLFAKLNRYFLYIFPPICIFHSFSTFSGVLYYFCIIEYVFACFCILQCPRKLDCYSLFRF